MAARTWLAILLSLAVWFGYERFLASKQPLQPTPPTVGTSGTTTSPTAMQPVGSDGKFPSGQSTQEDFWVKAENLEIAFSDVGGQIATVRLPKYRENPKPDAAPVTLVSTALSPYSLSTLFSDSELAPLRNAKYSREVGSDNVVRYSASLPSGISLRKEYKIDAAKYQVEAQYILKIPPSAKRSLGNLSLPMGGKDLLYEANEPLKAWEVVLYQNESVTRSHVDSLKDEDQVHQGNTSWLAFGNRYFSTVVRNESKLNPDAVFTKSREFIGGYLRYPIVLKSDESELALRVKYFMGPKDYSLLSATPGLRKLIDYGMFSVLAYPLLDLLKFFYHYIHNYGIAIILLTIVVRLLFYPLSYHSFKSMKEMQKLQPRLAELKEKYGDDRERFQREQMALFKTHKVNPFGSCLPIMVQIPVFIALYAVLGNSIELFQAPFFGWIHDLSSKDPFYVFPILMGVSMVVQQKMTPAVGMDPTQQKIMMIMPVVFSFMMLSLPSGLTVYMFVSTILGIVQQLIISRKTGNASLSPVKVTAAPDKA